ncbi:hypothetical protein LTR20_005904 [Exophiala xenobiotica]|nr:hypothetical protein LTS13_003128 [Exophiala xenobiotica]KAK5396120.1 hypothetical protein LTR79_006874 [Exophiala xenobiotica]KAK5424073.1 hypothetical protein LTR90_001419 [Exophiala xenobiotica]KAK5461955.1 hypothetical protein LTR20_005904 [Exophiala xenobiotica]KAK5479876.1 hypothetical protein LTR26_007729 [Exophiala xenobiotica]
MSTTPSHVGSKIDWAIDHLNAHWDLRLPKLHGVQAKDADAKKSLSYRCFARIRFLCFRVPIEKILADFDEQARAIHSKWVFKPSQERGTLPRLPVTKSLMGRGKDEKQVIRLSDSEREKLHQLLFQNLDEHYELARMTKSLSIEQQSDASFQTAPTTPSKVSTSRTQSLPVTPSKQILYRQDSREDDGQEPVLKDPRTGSAKRSIASPSNKNKRQQKLAECNYFRPTCSSIRPRPPLLSTASLFPEPTSFDTVLTTHVSSVFDTPDHDQDVFASNDTSLMSSQAAGDKAEESQDLLPTQDLQDFLEDEEFKRSFDEISMPQSSFDPIDVALSHTFRRQACLPQHVPFWLCWEIHRLAHLFGELPLDLHGSIKKLCKSDTPSFDQFWSAVKALSHETAISPPQKSEVPHWMETEDRYEDPSSTNALYLTASLEWSDKLSQGMFKFRPSEIRLEQSCRLYRKFGADRFLVLFAPYFSTDSYPSKLREKLRAQDKDNGAVYKKITKFLTEGRHFIAGRYWRVFYVEPEKRKNRRKEHQQPRQKFFLFAETGYDMIPPPLALEMNRSALKISGHHQEISLETVAQWHMPIAANSTSTDLKLFSRWGIGLSKTTPTITLRREEFVELHDPTDGPVMNDGCALMSLTLAKAIWEASGKPGDMPCAVQGRIAGAKGLWIVDDQDRRPQRTGDRGYWIEVSDSQLKIKPHPRRRKNADDSLRTFEVLKWAGECKPGHLNIQLISILEDRGVPRNALQDALTTDTRAYSESLTAAIGDTKDGRVLLLWMHINGLLGPCEAQRNLGSFPSDRRQQMRLLLEAGFNPSDCAKIVKCAFKILSDYMEDYVERLWITQSCSTTVFCVPDPTGLLEEDEVCINFSKPITDPRTGMTEFSLNKIDVLVARNPAYLASDIQKRKAVYIHELRHYRNVIIFPTKGNQPLASMLSGGDYDGDTCWVCWDPTIVEPFENANLTSMPSEEQCGMVQESRPLSGIFTEARPLEEALQDFLLACIDFNARPSLMGACSTEHERLVYSLSQQQKANKLSSSGTVTLAALAGYLVDSNKQGWSLDQKSWKAVRAKASGSLKLEEPWFKSESPPSGQKGPYANVIDFLKFEIATGEKEKALMGFQKLNPDAGSYDIVLSKYWKDAVEDGKKEKSRMVENPRATLRNSKATAQSRKLTDQHSDGRADQACLSVFLEDLSQQIKNLLQKWKQLAPVDAIDSSFGETKDPARYTVAVQRIYELYQASEPKDIDHGLRRRYEDDKEAQFSYWSLLRASCLHYEGCRKGVFPEWVWYVAGRELCHLKVLHHEGNIRLVPEDVLGIMQINSKFAKATLERKTFEAEDMDAGDMIDTGMMEG